MFELRPSNQDIEFDPTLGTSRRMATNTTPKNGDTVIVKYREYELEITNITCNSGGFFYGKLGEIINSNTEESSFEFGAPLNISCGKTIEFSENNIFRLGRKS